MHWLSNLRIATKLAIAFLALLAFLGGLGTVSLIMMASMNRAAAETGAIWLPSVFHVSEMNTNMADFRIKEYKHVLSATQSDMAQAEREMADVLASLQQNQGKFAALITSAEERLLYDQFLRAREAYVQSHDRLLALSRSLKTEEARRLLTGDSRRLYDEASGALSKLAEVNARGAKEAVAHSDAAYRSAYFWVAGLLVTALALGIFLAFAISRGILTAVTRLKAGAERIAGGDLTVTIEALSRDELGQLTVTFADMAQSLRQVVRGVVQTACDVSATSQQMSSASDETARASQQISATINQLAEGSSQQADSVTASARVAQQMNESAAVVTASAQQAAAASATAAGAADTGRHALDVAVDKMQGLHGTVTDSARTVQQLGQLGDQIGAIVGMIKGIASQTNLLALNAAIEAARAGEQGRGFAVVAEEVRKLAGESARSAEEITDMVTRIQQETRSAVAAMERGTNEASETVQLIGQAGQSIRHIVNAVQAADQEVGAISSAIVQLSAGLQRVAVNMEEISSVSEENAAGAEEVSAATEEQSASIEELAASSQGLAQMADDLQQMVSRFKVDHDQQALPSGTPSLSPGREPRRHLVKA